MRTAASIALRTFTVTGGLCFAALAAGLARGSGPVVGWGLGAPPPMISALAIDMGSAEHSCAIQAGTGAVICWGDNSFGQAMPPPSVNGTSGTAAAIAVGEVHRRAV